MALDSSVAHEAFAQENLLSLTDIGAGENDIAVRINDLFGNRWFVDVGAACQSDECSETYNHCYTQTEYPPAA